jgi:hypothetical protein
MNYFRLVIFFVSTAILAFILHLLVYQTYFTYASVSNSLFVVGIILLLPSVVAISSAYQMFKGIQYVFKVIASPSFQRNYPRFHDYKAEKVEKSETTVFLEVLISSLVIVIIAMILARASMS